jgi:hypothetical protein
MLADGLVDELHLFVYPLTRATTLTRAAGSGPLSAAADMPRGKPIETPTAHSSTPTRTIQGFPA